MDIYTNGWMMSSETCRYITLLGSTGSIGQTTLSVISRHSDKFRVFALVARHNVDTLVEQCRQFSPSIAVLTDAHAARILKNKLKAESIPTKVYSDNNAIIEAVSAPKVDTVVAAITGAAGLMPTYAAIEAGKCVLLANKESLVMAGKLFKEAIQKHHGVLLPIDSEHNAIFQVLPDNYNGSPHLHGVKQIYLTASGGALRDCPVNELESVTPEHALKHPNWSMGPKVTIDSATMMNKGLELIEAAWLFDLNIDQMTVLIHPQSVIHSMVEYLDGSTLAQLSYADMRVPIAQALAYPKRIESGVGSLNWPLLSGLTFDVPDYNRYPCLPLAKTAMVTGGTMPVILNASNECAVNAFLNHQLGFTQIASVVKEVMDKINAVPIDGLDTIWAADTESREFAAKIINRFSEKKRV